MAKSKNGMRSILNMLFTQYTAQQNDRRVGWGHSDVASCLMRSRRPARLSAARMQSADMDSRVENQEKRTRRVLIRGYCARTYLYHALLQQTAAVNSSQSAAWLRCIKHKISREAGRARRHYTNYMRSTWARVLGSGAQCSTLGSNLRGAKTHQPQFAGVCSNLRAQVLIQNPKCTLVSEFFAQDVPLDG